MGLQIAGGEFGDADVLGVSRELEEAMPFRDRKPPAWA